MDQWQGSTGRADHLFRRRLTDCGRYRREDAGTEILLYAEV